MKYVKTNKSITEVVQHIIDGGVFFEGTASGWKIVDGNCCVASLAMKYSSGNLHEENNCEQEIVEALTFLGKVIITSSFVSKSSKDELGNMCFNISISEEGKSNIKSLKEIAEYISKLNTRLDRLESGRKKGM